MPVLAIPAALLRLARLSNAPTVASQCLAGAALGALAQSDAGIDWIAFARSCGIVVLAYVGGMILNDVLDEPVDRVERPGRPLPAKAIGRATAAAAAALCLGGALALAWWLGHPTEARLATALVIAAVLYDATHLFTAATTVLLGICRGLVYIVAATAQADGPWTRAGLDGPIAIATLVGLYVTLFSLVARGEADRGAPSPTGVRCDRCGSREVAERTTCPNCGQAVEPSAGIGTLGHRRAEPWSRGAWLEWLWTIPLLGVFAAAATRGADAVTLSLSIPVALAFAFVAFSAGRLARTGGPRIGPAVGRWIAAIALVDATILLALGETWPAIAALGCFGLARLLALRIAPS